MSTLRITQTALPDGEHRVQLDLTGDGVAQSAFAQFPFTLSDQDREDLRWYLEDYLQYPIDPAPEIAARVEHRMRTLGGELYTELFDGNPASRRLWARLEPELAGMRVEVASEVDADAVLPWELLHDPHSNTDLAVHASSFVRVQRQTARPAVAPQVGAAEVIRVLLIICRPGGRQDVPFRSVASHLVRLSATAREVFELEVLRPPTFAQLAWVLRQAASRGEPYHVVHFDGHGTWAELPGTRQGPHGYLLFENPEATDNIEPVDGLRLGNLLAETGVPVLVLNACQSARADLSLAPHDVTTAPADVQTRVRAYGSLAQVVVDAGVAGVVAMRYSVYVVTAAQFIGDLYAALLEGLPLGSAVSRGRKQLAAQPNREIAFEARPLQDWVVPVVYEAVPVKLPPMPMAEGVQLARAVADKQGHRLTQVADWRPLLAYAQGNPLTITVLVSQALRAGLHSRKQVAAFVASLRGGEAPVSDDEQQGRARSLGASLGYGFDHAFDEQERAQLALLHLFRECINVDALPRMGRGHPRLQVTGIPELASVDRAAGIGLLDRAAEIGLLTSLGHGWYRIHPALPWFLAGEFAQHYGTAGAPRVEQAMHAFATAVGNLGNDYLAAYTAGRGEAVTGLRLEEANFLHARALARTNGWWDQAIDAMQGLRGLYEHTGRWIEWARLVEELIPDLVDTATGGPLPEREHTWHLLTGYRVSLAFRAKDWTLAQRLGQAMLAWDRQNAATALAVPPAELDDRQRQRIRSLAVTLELVGTSLREQRQSDCMTYFQEALELNQRIQAGHEAATLAFGVAQAYMDLPDLDDLDEAERLFQLSYHELGERDRLRRAIALGELGRIAHERFRRAPETPDALQERREALDRALVNYRQALALLPDDSLDNLALIHRRIGNIYGEAHEVASALHHYQQSIHHYETAGSRYDAAMTRYNAAIALAHHERFDDALPWAQAALRDYQTLGNRAAAEIAETQELIGLVTLAQQAGRIRTDPGGAG